MRITAVEEYGLRCLLNLAKLGPDGQLSISDIAERESLSVPYVSKLLSILRHAGLVHAARGRTGGFSIARPAEQINLYETLTALGGPLIDPNHCNRFAGHSAECVHLGDCSIHGVLGGLAGIIQEKLVQTSLADLVVSRQQPIHITRANGADQASRTEAPAGALQIDPISTSHGDRTTS